MARPKNPDNKTNIEEIRDKMDEAEKLEKSENLKPILEDEDVRESFRNYWALNKKNFNQSKDVEEIVWAHIKAIKHDDPELFESAVQHFGFKKK